MPFDPNATYAGTELMDITSTEHSNHISNYENDTTRHTVLSNSSLYWPTGAKKPIIVFISRKAIIQLSGIVPSGFTARADVVGITLTFGMDGNQFCLLARCADLEGLCPSSLQDMNYQNPNTLIDNTTLSTRSDSFKSSGYSKLYGTSTHPALSFSNLVLFELLYELTDAQRNTIGGSTTFHVVISDKFSTQCLTLNGNANTFTKEGDPCPPECYV